MSTNFLKEKNMLSSFILYQIVNIMKVT